LKEKGIMTVTDFEKTAFPEGNGLHACRLDVLQVNLGLRCNQACTHCHLECSPERPESMGLPVMGLVRNVAARIRPRLVDLTGGAPECHPRMRRFVRELREDGHTVRLRTNLTALLLPEHEGLPQFFRDHRVRLVASLPCYTGENVCAQRGAGTFGASIEAIRRLNAAGYGDGVELTLDLVHNPGGAFLPGEQTALEADYRRELGRAFDLHFSRLLTITNMPVGRFGACLRQEGKEEEYIRLLKNSFNPSTLPCLMCRSQVEVGWDGTLYDCDFNLALRLAVNHGAPSHIRNFDPEALEGRRIVTGPHCYACTAGAGSSCGGALI
jgi:radical SAM/Cys-rich protein